MIEVINQQNISFNEHRNENINKALMDQIQFLDGN